MTLALLQCNMAFLWLALLQVPHIVIFFWPVFVCNLSSLQLFLVHNDVVPPHALVLAYGSQAFIRSVTSDISDTS